MRNVGLHFPETSVTNFPASLNLTKRDEDDLKILYSVPDSLIGESKRTKPETSIDEPKLGPWREIDFNLIPPVLTEILHEEFQKKLESLWTSVRQLDHYSQLSDRLTKELGRRVVKSSIRSALQNIPIAAKQPLVLVVQDLREKVVFTSLKSSGLAMQNGGFTREKKLWKDILEVSDDYFGCFKSEKSKISRVQSSVILKVFRKIRKGYSIPLPERSVSQPLNKLGKLLAMLKNR